MSNRQGADIARQGLLERTRARHAEVLEMHRRGDPPEVIAKAAGYNPTTVKRILAANGVPPSGAPKPRVTADELEKARAMLDDGASYWQVAETLGRAWDTWHRNLPGYPVLTRREVAQRANMMKQLGRVKVR